VGGGDDGSLELDGRLGERCAHGGAGFVH
jgi:hypothetical protein